MYFHVFGVLTEIRSREIRLKEVAEKFLLEQDLGLGFSMQILRVNARVDEFQSETPQVGFLEWMFGPTDRGVAINVRTQRRPLAMVRQYDLVEMGSSVPAEEVEPEIEERRLQLLPEAAEMKVPPRLGVRGICNAGLYRGVRSNSRLAVVSSDRRFLRNLGFNPEPLDRQTITLPEAPLMVPRVNAR